MRLENRFVLAGLLLAPALFACPEEKQVMCNTVSPDCEGGEVVEHDKGLDKCPELECVCPEGLVLANGLCGPDCPALGEEPACIGGTVSEETGEDGCPVYVCTCPEFSSLTDGTCACTEDAFCADQHYCAEGVCTTCPQEEVPACHGGSVSTNPYGNNCAHAVCTCPENTTYNGELDTCVSLEPCATYDTKDPCNAADEGCRYLSPGCGDNPTPVGCYTAADCSSDNDCPLGKTCQLSTHNPCAGQNCDACGMEVYVCLAGTAHICDDNTWRCEGSLLQVCSGNQWHNEDDCASLSQVCYEFNFYAVCEDPESEHCATSNDCSGVRGNDCLPPDADMCPNWRMPPDECTGLMDCPHDTHVCDTVRENCADPHLACVPVCTADSCNDGYYCNVDGKCHALRCDVSETDLRVDCPTYQDCLPESTGASDQGCLERACTADTDCSGGGCVNGVCKSRPGTCSFQIQ